MAEQIWAPWRFDYVQSADEANASGCIFCDFPKEDDDRNRLILHRGERAFVILNAYPYTSGHLMVAPYRHGQDFTQLTDQELLEANQLVKSAIAWLTQVFTPDGFNIGVNLGRAAGAGIPQHIHWHVVPRWAGDTNFMTTVGDVRVIPQDLRTTWDKLRAASQTGA